MRYSAQICEKTRFLGIEVRTSGQKPGFCEKTRYTAQICEKPGFFG
jgi:hypothetical protein